MSIQYSTDDNPYREEESENLEENETIQKTEEKEIMIVYSSKTLQKTPKT